MTAPFLEKLESLPPSQQQVLLDFAEYLVRKYASAKPQKKNRQAGTFQGFLVYMADDFNAPVDDFKEYQ